MNKHEATPERLGTLSDAIFAIIITILVLNLKMPGSASLQALLSLWPQGLSYAVSYVLLTIVWINHHYLFRYAVHATPRLLWGNFAHLFAVSVVPFATSWIAETRLGAIPVALYAGIFVMINATYLVLYWEAVERRAPYNLSPRVRKMLKMRSMGTLLVFACAAVAALWWPIAGMSLICVCLLFYLRPEAPGVDA
jgi:uncharacterized membrane protein